MSDVITRGLLFASRYLESNASQSYSGFANGSNATSSSSFWINDITKDGLNFKEIVSLFLVFIAGSFGAAAGTGGGAIYTPLFIVLFGLLYEAIPLSKAAVCGTALAFFVLNVLKPVPVELTNYPNRFAYDAIMIMEPATLLGTTFGVLSSRMYPMWIITVTMAVLLGASAHFTFKKANKVYEKETASEGSGEENMNISSENLHGLNNAVYGTNAMYEPIMPSRSRNTIGNEEWLGWRCLCTVGLCFGSTVVTTFLGNSTKNRDPLVECGSLGFWVLVLANAIVCICVGIYNLSFLIRNMNYLRNQCTVEWCPRSGIRYTLLCVCAGFMSALCGVGGSTIKNPILLQMNLSPTLAKSTSQLMLITTASSSALQFYFSGEMPLVYGIIFFVLGTLSGFTGKYFIDLYVISHGGRQSTIAYLLGFYIVFSAFVMSFIGVVVVVAQLYPTINYDLLWFRNVCDEMPDSSEAFKWLTGFTD